MSAEHQLISRIVSVGPESVIAKLGELQNSVVRLQLACEIVHDPI